MKIEHYQTGRCCLKSLISKCTNALTETNSIKFYTEQDKPLRGLPDSDLINQDLITTFRKQFGMIDNDFNMVLTDFDMKVKVSSKKKPDTFVYMRCHF